MERKTNIEIRHNVDEDRDKFVKDFNKNSLSLDKLNNTDNAIKVEKENNKGETVDIYTLRGGEFNLLVSSPFLNFINPASGDGRDLLMNSQKNIIKASKMPLEEVRKEYRFGNNYISTSLISDSNLLSINWTGSLWNFGYSNISPEDLINGGTIDQFTLGEETELGICGNVDENLFENIHFNDDGYNEIAIWRYNSKGEPRKPDFIVTTERDIERHMGRNISLATEAAAEFDIPLVIINCSYFEGQKIDKIDRAMEANYNGDISDADFLNLYLRGARSFDRLYSLEQKLYANDAYDRHLDNIAEIMENMRHKQNFENASSEEELVEKLQNMRDIFLKRDAIIQSWSNASLSKAGISKGFRAEIVEDKDGERELQFIPSENEMRIQKIMFEAETFVLSEFLYNDVNMPSSYSPFIEKVEADFVDITGDKIKISDEFWRVKLPGINYKLHKYEKDTDGSVRSDFNFIGDMLDLSSIEIEKLEDLAKIIEKK